MLGGARGFLRREKQRHILMLLLCDSSLYTDVPCEKG